MTKFKVLQRMRAYNGKFSVIRIYFPDALPRTLFQVEQLEIIGNEKLYLEMTVTSRLSLSLLKLSRVGDITRKSTIVRSAFKISVHVYIV